MNLEHLDQELHDKSNNIELITQNESDQQLIEYTRPIYGRNQVPNNLIWMKWDEEEDEDNKTLDEVTLTPDLSGIPLRLKMGNPFTRDPSLLL